MNPIKEKYISHVIPEMKKKFGLSNDLAVPKILKIIVHSGTGSLKDEAKRAAIQSSLAMITGQKVSPRKAKKSIASFKLREGTVIGYVATLRGKKMFDFLEKLINVAIPRIRDFRGIEKKLVDEMGNITLGFKDHTVFPETGEEDVRGAFGLEVTIVTSGKNKEEGYELLKSLGLPFVKG